MGVTFFAYLRARIRWTLYDLYCPYFSPEVITNLTRRLSGHFVTLIGVELIQLSEYLDISSFSPRVTQDCCFMASVHQSHYECKREVAKHERSVRVTGGDEPIFYTIDIILLNFSFSKPIESLETCISMASLRHKRTSIRLWSTLMTYANCLAEIA